MIDNLVELFSIAPAIIAAGISAGGSLLGGAMQDKGTRAANKQNLKIAREQMAFQERMSSTAYQRSAKDLTAAGLNRILALGSPASSPSGAIATMQSETAGKGEALKTGTASALQAKIAQTEFERLKAQTANINQQTLNEVEKTAISHNQKLMAERVNSALDLTKTPITGASELMDFLPGIGNRLNEALQKRNTFRAPYDPKSVRSKSKSREIPLTWPQILRKMKDL